MAELRRLSIAAPWGLRHLLLGRVAQPNLQAESRPCRRGRRRALDVRHPPATPLAQKVFGLPTTGWRNAADASCRGSGRRMKQRSSLLAPNERYPRPWRHPACVVSTADLLSAEHLGLVDDPRPSSANDGCCRPGP